MQTMPLLVKLIIGIFIALAGCFGFVIYLDAIAKKFKAPDLSFSDGSDSTEGEEAEAGYSIDGDTGEIEAEASAHGSSAADATVSMGHELQRTEAQYQSMKVSVEYEYRHTIKGTSMAPKGNAEDRQAGARTTLQLVLIPNLDKPEVRQTLPIKLKANPKDENLYNKGSGTFKLGMVSGQRLNVFLEAKVVARGSGSKDQHSAKVRARIFEISWRKASLI